MNRTNGHKGALGGGRDGDGVDDEDGDDPESFLPLMTQVLTMVTAVLKSEV